MRAGSILVEYERRETHGLDKRDLESILCGLGRATVPPPGPGQTKEFLTLHQKITIYPSFRALGGRFTSERKPPFDGAILSH